MTNKEYDRLDRMLERICRLRKELDYALRDAYEELRIEGFNLGRGYSGDRLWFSIDDAGFIVLNWTDKTGRERYMEERHVRDCMRYGSGITPNGPWEEDE